jgi:hypothetical protein
VRLDFGHAKIAKPPRRKEITAPYLFQAHPLRGLCVFV